MERVEKAVALFAEGFNCSQAILLGCDIGTPEGLAQAKERGVFGSRCPLLVREAAQILEEMLSPRG